MWTLCQRRIPRPTSIRKPRLVCDVTDTPPVLARCRAGKTLANYAEAVEKVAEWINEEKCVKYVSSKAIGAEGGFATSTAPMTYDTHGTMEVGGIEPPSENVKVRMSTCVARFLNLVPESSNRRDITRTSLSFSLAPCPETQHGASLPYRRS